MARKTKATPKNPAEQSDPSVVDFGSEPDVKELPNVTILVCTYDRLTLLEETLQRLAEFIHYDGDKLTWLICDDSSPDDYKLKVEELQVVNDLNAVIISTDVNSGWAANVNNGLRAVKDDYVFFIEDDYFATQPIRLDAMAALMEVKPDIGMVRARGIAGTHIVAHLFEADVAEYIPDWQDGLGVKGKLAYWQLDSGSPTPYVYSNGAHLKHRRFHEFYGLYPEGLKLGETEESYAHMVKDKMHTNPGGVGVPAVTILPQDVYQWFDHVGESYQLTDKDKRRE